MTETVTIVQNLEKLIVTNNIETIVVDSPNGGSVVVSSIGVQGAPGASNAVVRYDQIAPAATWIVNHTKGYVPIVQIYLATGERVESDIVGTTTIITVTFPSATAGFLLYS